MTVPLIVLAIGPPAPSEKFWLQIVYDADALAAAIVAMILTAKYVDKGTTFRIATLGKDSVVQSFVGLLVGSVLMFVAASTLLVFDWASMVHPAYEVQSVLLPVAISTLLNAAFQEAIFRGYVFSRVAQSFHLNVAVVVSAMLFTLLHAGAIIEGGAIPGLNLFLAGVLLAYGYWLSKNLLFTVFLHFAWNFVQGPILGSKVTGAGLGDVHGVMRVTGPELWTGGEFGMEGGLVVTIVTLCGIAMFAWLVRCGSIK